MNIWTAQARYSLKRHALAGVIVLLAKLKWGGTSYQMLTAIRQKYPLAESRQCEHLVRDGNRPRAGDYGGGQ